MQNTSTAVASQSTRLLLFIHQLNIFGRQLSLYPANHPQIKIGTAAVVRQLQLYCRETGADISLEYGPESLFCKDIELKTTSPSVRSLHQRFAARDIVTLTFSGETAAEDLLLLHRFLWPVTNGTESGCSPAAHFDKLAIPHIQATFIDYGRFEPVAAEGPSCLQAETVIWDELIKPLSGKQQTELQTAPSPIRSIAGQSALETSLSKPSVTGLIARLIEVRNPSPARIDARAQEQASALPPQVIDKLLQQTFKTLDRHHDEAAVILGSLPKHVLSEAFHRISSGRFTVSSRLMTLLRELHQNAQKPGPRTAVTRTCTDRPGTEIDVLFYEDNLDDYVPITYQESLTAILQGQIRSTLSDAEIHRLQEESSRFAIEKNFCGIMFELLKDRVNEETELNMQQNLLELSDFFAETGDFLSLKSLFLKWSEYLYSGVSQVRFLDEKVLANQTRSLFMNNLLDSLGTWSQEKLAEARDYICTVGEPFAEPLVERLATEEKEDRRELWMTLLTDLGPKALPIIIDSLEKGPWYLTRNLLVILGRQRDRIPMKPILKLTNHSSAQVRAEAIRILAAEAPGLATRLLLKELSSEDPRTIMAVSARLTKSICDSRVLEQLHRHLIPLPQNSEELDMKRHLLKVLAAIADPGTRAVLENILKVRIFLRPRRHREFQAEVRRALESFRSADCL